jgi:hypothetical protein
VLKEASEVRIRVKKKESNYTDALGIILYSNCDGTFRVKIITEGYPIINLKPEEVDPC